MSELLDCPFCGPGTPFIVANEPRVLLTGGYLCRTICQCGAAGPWAKSAAEAIAAWNRRAQPTVGEWIPVTERLPVPSTSMETHWVWGAYRFWPDEPLQAGMVRWLESSEEWTPHGSNSRVEVLYWSPLLEAPALQSRQGGKG